MDYAWIVEYLNEANELVRTAGWGRQDGVDRDVRLEADREFTRRALQVGQVLASLVPGLETRIVRNDLRGWDWVSIRAAIDQGIYTATEGQTITEKLGPPPGPILSASSLHPTVWRAAQSFWESGHRREAVHTAAKAVNAHLQERMNRRDINDGDLVAQAFSTNEPTPGVQRLRMPPYVGPTYESRQVGALQFGQGCFKALRNPPAHEYTEDELDEHLALEQLAAFSLLARWIDEAHILTDHTSPFPWPEELTDDVDADGHSGEISNPPTPSE